MVATVLAVLGCSSSPPAEPSARPPVTAVAEPAPFVEAASASSPLSVSPLADGILLAPRRDASSPWLLVQKGTLTEVTAPSLGEEPSDANHGIAEVGAAGAWGGRLWLRVTWFDQVEQDWTRFDASVVERAGTTWKSIAKEKGATYFSLWEAPRGCLLGLKGNGVELGTSDVLGRTTLLCDADRPRDIALEPVVSERETPRILGAIGLVDGGVAAALGPERGVFASATAKPRLGVWTRDGQLHSTSLPVPAWFATGEKIDVDAERGVLVVELAAGRIAVSAGLGPAKAPYLAVCEKTCAEVALPAARSITFAGALADGSLVVAGRDPAGTLAVWSARDATSFARLGAIAATDGDDVVGVFGSDSHDVWILVGHDPRDRGAPLSRLLHNRPSLRSIRLGGPTQ